MAAIDNILSYKRYASNLVVANIVITCVWTVLALSFMKKIREDNDSFIIWSLLVISVANVICAYFGIMGVIGRNSCQLTTYYITSEVTVVGECFVCLVMMLTHNRSVEQPVISTVQSAVAIILLITQVWLLFETKNFQNLAQSISFTGFDDFKARRMSSPPNICDIEKNSRVFTLTDQLLFNCPDSIANERLTSHPYSSVDTLHPFGDKFTSSSVYQSPTTSLSNQRPEGGQPLGANQWYLTSSAAYPSSASNWFDKF